MENPGKQPLARPWRLHGLFQAPSVQIWIDFGIRRIDVWDFPSIFIRPPKKNIYKETWQFHKGNKNGLPQFLLNFFGKESFKSAFFTAPFFMVQMAWGAGGEMFRILIDATWLMGYPSYWLHLVTINKPPRYATDVLVDFRRRDVSPSSLEQPTGNTHW